MSAVRLTRAATQDLTDVMSWIAGDDPIAAERYVRRLQRAVQLLGVMPEMGRRRDELAPDLRSFPVEQLVLFYRVLPDAVEVLRVVSGHRDVDALF